MRILVLGGTGKIGTAVAWDLLRRDGVESVGLVGRDRKKLEETRAFLGDGPIQLHALGIDDPQLQAVMEGYDVGVSALPDRRTSYRGMETAIKAGLDFVDMLEEYHRRPDLYETEGLVTPPGVALPDYGEWLHEQALRQEVTVLDGMGFAPGLSNITVGHALLGMDPGASAVARVGGVPEKRAAERRPLKYMVTWAFDHVLREYMIPLQIIRDGKVVEVDALTGRERFRFREFGVDEELECAITPGMPSFVYTRPELHYFAEKTIRWPGHYDGIDTLKSCGLLDLDPVEVGDCRVVPRDVLLKLIEPRLQPGPDEGDVCVMWNTVEGTRDGKSHRVDYYMWDQADRETGLSSMARVTGFATSVGAWLVGKGEIAQHGIVPPEDGVAGELYGTFMSALEERNIRVREVVAAGKG